MANEYEHLSDEDLIRELDKYKGLIEQGYGPAFALREGVKTKEAARSYRSEEGVLAARKQAFIEEETARTREGQRIAGLKEEDRVRGLESDISGAKSADGFFVPESAGKRLRGGFLGEDFSKESGIYETEAPRGTVSAEDPREFLGGYSNIGSKARPLSPEQQAEVERLQGVQSGVKVRDTGKIDLDRITKARKYETDIISTWQMNSPMVEDKENKGKKRPATVEEQMVLARKLSDNAFGVGGVKGLEAPRIDVRKEARAHEKTPFRTFGATPEAKEKPSIPTLTEGLDKKPVTELKDSDIGKNGKDRQGNLYIVARNEEFEIVPVLIPPVRPLADMTSEEHMKIIKEKAKQGWGALQEYLNKVSENKFGTLEMPGI